MLSPGKHHAEAPGAEKIITKNGASYIALTDAAGRLADALTEIRQFWGWQLTDNFKVFQRTDPHRCGSETAR